MTDVGSPSGQHKSNEHDLMTVTCT